VLVVPADVHLPLCATFPIRPRAMPCPLAVFLPGRATADLPNLMMQFLRTAAWQCFPLWSLCTFPPPVRTLPLPRVMT